MWSCTFERVWGKLALTQNSFFFFSAEMDPLPLLSLNPPQLKAIFYQAARNATVKQCQGTGWAALTPTRLELCCLESSPAAPQCPSWLEKWHKGHRAITEPEWGGEELCPLITHLSESSGHCCFHAQRWVPSRALWSPLWTFLQGLVLSEGQGFTAGSPMAQTKDKVSRRWRRTKWHLPFWLLPWFLLPTSCQK